MLRKVFVALKQVDDWKKHPNWQDEVSSIEGSFIIDDGGDYIFVLLVDSAIEKLKKIEHLRYQIDTSDFI